MKIYPQIQYIFEGRQGLSFARRKGVENTYTKWIVFIDDDNLLKDNWIVNAYAYIVKNNDKNIGEFGGAIVPLIEDNINDINRLVLKSIYKRILDSEKFTRLRSPQIARDKRGLLLMENYLS